MIPVDKSLLSQLPKKYHPHITWLEKAHNECDNSHVYFLTMEYDGEEISATIDTIAELKWACRYICENRTFNF